MRTADDPMDPRIARWVELHQRVARSLEKTLGHVALGIPEERGIAPEPTHDRSREEHAEHLAPPQRVPLLVVELPAGVGSFRRQEIGDGCWRMCERQHQLAEGTQIALEAACAREAKTDYRSTLIPEALYRW